VARSADVSPARRGQNASPNLAPATGASGGLVGGLSNVFHLIGWDGSTVESIRESIGFPLRIERVLREYSNSSAEDALWIEARLNYRQAVRREFERLVREDVPIAELPKFDESELDNCEKASAVEQT